MDRDEMLSRLADDLEHMKSAVRRSASVLREVAGPSHYKGLLWYLGSAIVALCLLFAGAVVVALSASAFKLLTVGRVARAVDRRLTALSFFRQYYAPVIVHLYPPLILIAAGVTAWLAATDRGFFTVGTVGLFSGVMLNLLGVNLHQDEYLVFGYWMLLTGAASLFVPGLPAALWAAIVFGGGCFAFAAAVTVLGRRR